MKTLHLFGDSFTQGHNLDKTFPPYKKWKEYRGKDLPDTWADILGQKLGMLINNHAVAGMSNPEIFQTICEHSNEFELNDIVIINWTYNHRFRWVVWDSDEMMYKWRRLSSNKESNPIIPEIVREHVAINRTHSLQIQEIYNYQKLLIEYSKSKKFHLFFWSADVDIINDLPNDTFMDFRYLLHDEIMRIPPYNESGGKTRTLFDVVFKYGGKTIEMETDNQILNGNHMGESGHKVQAELFIEYITRHLNLKKII